MSRIHAVLVLALLAVASGCSGGPGTAATPTRGASTTAATTTATPTSTLAAHDAGERAVAAEQERIEAVAAEFGNLTGLTFGAVNPPEFEVIDRNASGVVVRVTVGYSVSVDCDGDGDPESAVDGASTVARYRVTDDAVALLAVTRAFLGGGSPDAYC